MSWWKKELIWKDIENKQEELSNVKNFLVDNDVRVVLTLGSSFEHSTDDVVIERNFLSFSSSIVLLNGVKTKVMALEDRLNALLFPTKKTEYPSFCQVIAHNIRYSDECVNNTLRYLHPATRSHEYESLFL